MCLLIIEKSTFFLARALLFSIDGEPKALVSIMWEKLKSTEKKVFYGIFFTFLFLFFFCGLFLSCEFLHFLCFFLLIEYIRQLINLYNKIETINLLGTFTLSYFFSFLKSIRICFNNFMLFFYSVFFNRKISRKNSF